MSYTELFMLISKPWANVNDIKKIASCGRDNASSIRDKIRTDIMKQGKRLPNARELIVPMNNVIEYLDLNINYIAEMAKLEKTLNT